MLSSLPSVGLMHADLTIGILLPHPIVSSSPTIQDSISACVAAASNLVFSLSINSCLIDNDAAAFVGGFFLPCPGEGQSFAS